MTTMDLTTTPATGASPLHGRFDGRGAGYLAACTGGLWMRETVAAAHAEADLWASGRGSAARYDLQVSRARAAFATLAGRSVDDVAIGSQTSVFAGLVAASLPDGAEVLCVDGDFSSMVLPFLQQAHRGVRVRHVPLAALADGVATGTTLVAYSLVQSATGEIADAAGIRAAADRVGARVLCDVTQAAGWLPLEAGVADAVVCHAYKWLCSPRGVCFMGATPAFADELRPIHAGWYAGEDVWASCYGPTGEETPVALARSARRFDVSPAWQAVAAAVPALEAFAAADARAVHDHDVALADAFADGLRAGRPGTCARGSAIVTWGDPAGDDLARLTAAGVVASGRAGRARVAFHVWNDEADVARALRALGA